VSAPARRASALAALLLLLPAAALAAEPPPPAEPAAREERFLYYLRTYPERPPDVTLAAVAALVEAGPFAERDRALYWLGSARLSLGDREGMRRQFERLRRDHAGTVWVERSELGMAEAAAQERDFGAALAWYARASEAQDPAVRELARISRTQVILLQHRQRAAWAAQLFAGLVLLWLLGSALRLERAALARGEPGRGPRQLLRAPAEARVLLPVLLVLALIALQQDPAARLAALEICAAGALLAWLSGARLRALGEPALRQRLLHGALVLLALAALAYAAVWRGDLVGMLLETLRAGPD
jgi:hypothetical protein